MGFFRPPSKSINYSVLQLYCCFSVWYDEENIFHPFLSVVPPYRSSSVHAWGDVGSKLFKNNIKRYVYIKRKLADSVHVRLPDTLDFITKANLNVIHHIECANRGRLAFDIYLASASFIIINSLKKNFRIFEAPFFHRGVRPTIFQFRDRGRKYFKIL